MTDQMPGDLMAFGLGYSALALARRLNAAGVAVSGTTRSPEKARLLTAEGFRVHLFDGQSADAELREAVRQASHVLVSPAPDAGGDPVLRVLEDDLAAAGRLSWIGYLSTVGVYGDHKGGEVTESSELRPVSERARRRVAAEAAWLEFGRRTGHAVQIFRLAGIYGPGRNQLEGVLSGKARRIVKPGQIFNRIHVEDIARVLEASMARPRAGAVYNVADDEPAPPQDVVLHAARLLGLPPPPEVAFEAAEMSEMARSFYGESKRVSNRLIREELGVRLAYPTYRETLAALLPGVQARFT
ncbi:MAG: SDR family oxidoreductase [Hyphomicrobiaceae bacterium]